MINKTTILSLAIAATLFTGATHAAERSALLPAAAGDMVPARLVATKAALAADVERAPVDFAWALDPKAALSDTAPHKATSREFWTTLDAGVLAKGYAFQTTAPGALVRISPADGNSKAAIATRDLTLRIDGRTLDPSQALAQSADAEQLKAVGADFGNGTLVFQLKHAEGAGRVEIAAKNASGRYLVHVFEPDSAYALNLAADRDRALAGDSVRLHAQFDGAKGALAPDSIGGVVTAPDGRSIEVAFTRAKDGRYVADVALPADAGDGLALWEVHTFAVAKAAGGLVARDAKTSFAVSRPTARFTGDATFDAAKGGALSVHLPVETASSGRYEARGVLHGTAKDGSLQPFAIAHTAQWLEPGQGALTLKFGADLVPAGIGAPYELRDLRLNDQARLGQLEVRARALRIER